MGRKKLYTEDELRIKRNERRMKQYWANRESELEKSKERYHSNKTTDEVEEPAKPIKKVTIWGKHDIGEITYEADDDYNSGDYEGNII
jgi:hypothetical protein